MSIQPKKHPTDCLVAYGIDIFGDRWTMLLIRDMTLYGKRTYSDFLDSGEGIATNILAARLKHLEAEGIVEKERDPDNRRSYVYSLTEKGLALAPIMLEIIRWSGNHAPLDRLRKSRKGLLKRIESDPEGLLEEIRLRADKR